MKGRSNLAPVTAILVVALSAGCVSTTHDPVESVAATHSVATIANEFAETVANRAAPNHMRLAVDVQPPPDVRLAGFGPAIERELLASLGGRFHLFDTSGPEPPQLTHTLVCSYLLRDESLLVSLRLVDRSDQRIVALTQGEVAPDSLIGHYRLAQLLAPPVIYVSPQPATVRAPVAVESTPASEPEPVLVADTAAVDGRALDLPAPHQNSTYERQLPVDWEARAARKEAQQLAAVVALEAEQGAPYRGPAAQHLERIRRRRE